MVCGSWHRKCIVYAKENLFKAEHGPSPANEKNIFQLMAKVRTFFFFFAWIHCIVLMHYAWLHDITLHRKNTSTPNNCIQFWALIFKSARTKKGERRKRKINAYKMCIYKICISKVERKAFFALQCINKTYKNKWKNNDCVDDDDVYNLCVQRGVLKWFEMDVFKWR